MLKWARRIPEEGGTPVLKPLNEVPRNKVKELVKLFQPSKEPLKENTKNKIWTEVVKKLENIAKEKAIKIREERVKTTEVAQKKEAVLTRNRSTSFGTLILKGRGNVRLGKDEKVSQNILKRKRFVAN